MARSCITFSDKDFEKVKSHLPADLRKAIGDNKALAEYVLSKADISITSFLRKPNEYRQRLKGEELLLALQEKKQLDKTVKELALQKSHSILGKNLAIIKPTQTRANTIANNPGTIQIFEDNAQAYTVTHKNPVAFGDTMIKVEGGPTLNIGSDLNNPNSAKFRTDSNGEIIPNAKGFIMKKNAQDSKGKFISTAESLFTNADKKAFKIANQAIANEIKELLEADNKLEEGKRKYHKVQMLPSLGLGQTSALPLQLAKDLQSILEKTLGIHTTITVNQYMSTTVSKETGKSTLLYGLKVDNLGETIDKTADEKKEAAAKKRASERKELNKEVNESRQAVRPLGEEERLQPYKNMALSLLSKVFPNMQLRNARINWLSNRFSDMLTATLEDYRRVYTSENLEVKLQEYNNGEITADEYNDFLNIYYGLTRNDDQAQRLWALNNITVNAKDEQGNEIPMSLIEAIFNNINTEMQTVYNVVSNALESSDENALNETAKGIFMGKYDGFSAYSQTFMEKAERAGWSEKTQLQKAREQLLILKDAYEPFIQQPDLYKALQVAANEHLTFNEGIRLSLAENTASKEALNSLVTDKKQEDEEEGLAEDRSGLNLIKYKTLNPRNTLSVRIKRLLNSIDLVKMDQYGNKTFVYDDLGFKTKLNASYAYYVLAQELSGAFTPQAFENRLNDLVKKYAWAEGLVDKINEDTEQARDLKRELYRSFYLIFTPYAMITSTGAVKALNKTNTISSFLNSIQKNYETHVLLGDHSIYDANGLVDRNNLEYVHSFFDQAGVKNKDLEEKKPFLWALKTLGSPYRIKVKEALRALTILRGELEEGKKYALFSFLNNIGIDTSYINLNEILPYITAETLAAKRVEMQEASEETVSELDAFRSIFTPEMGKNLSNIWSSIDIITNTKYGKGFREGQHLVSAFNGAYTQIAKSLPIIDEGFSESNFSFNGKQRNSYCPPDFISRFCTAIQTLSQNELEEWLENEYGKYDFFKHRGEWNLPLLKELVMNPGLRKRFNFYNILGIGTQERADDNTIQNVSDEKMLEGLISAFWSQRSDSEGNNYGLYRTALLSDVDALVTITAPRYTTTSDSTYQEKIIKRLAKVLKQETERIIASRAAKNKGKTGVIVENYNDKRNNSGKFLFFSELEVSNSEGVKERKNAFMKRYEDALQTGSAVKIDKFFQEEAEKIVEKRANEFIQSFTDDQLVNLHRIKEQLQQQDESATKVKQEEDSTDNTNELDDTSTEKDENKISSSEAWEAEKKQYQEELKEFFYNDYYMQSQLIELFGGDLAQYKNLQDFIKRNKQSYSAGQRMWSTDENGNEMKDRAIFLEDSTCLVNDFIAIKELLFSQPDIDTATRGIINRTIAIWKAGTCETDGQAFRTLPSLRRLLKALGGKWTDEMEDAYNRIMQGQLKSKDFIVLWNAMKPFVYTHESRVVNGRTERINLQYKNSEYLMTGLLTALGTQLQQAPYLRGLHKFMNEHNVDIVQFHSAVKIGCNSMFDINYKNGEASEKIISEAVKNLDAGRITQEEYNNIVQKERYQTEKEVYDALETQLSQMSSTVNENDEEISDAFHETPLSDYMVMQPTEDHMLDNVAIFGSQLRNIIPADLSEAFQVTINGTTMDRDTAIKYYNALITDQMLDSFAKINKRFASPKALSEYLQEMAANNPKYSPDIKAAFELDENGNFNIPLNSPSLTNKVEDLLLSAYKNNVTRQKIKGGNAVLVSNYGVSDQLHIKYNNNDAKQGIEYIECYMPFYAKDMYQNFLESKITEDGEVWTIDYKKVEQAVKAGLFDENLLKIIGYRIPTEDKYSIMPIKIKGFLPLTAGSMIMLPSDIITMSGTDFDIDKLFLMLREYETSDAGKKMNMAFDEYMTQHYGKEWQNDERFIDEAKFVNKYEHTFDEMNAFEDEHQDTYHAFLDEMYAKDATAYNNLYYNLNGNPLSKMSALKIKEQFDENGNFDVEATSQMANQQNSFKRYSIRNNALIDIIWGIMTSPEGSRLAFYPGDFSSIKQSAAEQKILNNVTALTEFTKRYAKEIKEKGILATMHTMSQEALDEFFDEYSGVSDPLSIMNYMSNHRNLMDGNALIGASAINSSFHYKFQFLNLSIKEANQFNIKLLGMAHPKKVTKVDAQLSELTKERVGRTCAEFQAAAPDNGKTPCLGYMGVNLQNMGFAGGMARLGFDISSIGVILKSEDLVAVGEDLYKQVVNTDRKKYSFKMFGGDIAEVVDKLAEFRMNPEQFVDNPANQAFAMKYASWYNNLKQITSDLKSVQVVAKSDSVNNALPTSVAEVLQQQLAVAQFVEKLNSDSFSIINLDKAVNTSLDPSKMSQSELRQAILKSPIPRLQAAYTLGIVGGRQQVGQYLPYLNNTTLKAILKLQNMMGTNMAYASQTNRLKRFCAELTTFLLSKNSIFADTKDAKGNSVSQIDQRNYYIHDFPVKFQDFINQKNEEGEYLYPQLREMSFIKKINNASGKGITIKESSSKTTIQVRQSMMEEFNSIFFNEDNKISNLGFDLIMYCYYSSGFNYGHSNLANFITTAIQQKMPTFVDALNKGTNEWLDADDVMINSYVDQFMLNNYDAITRITSKGHFEKVAKNEDNGRARIKIKKTALFNKRGKYLTESGRPKKFLSRGGHVYMYVPEHTKGSTAVTWTNGALYEEVPFNKTSMSAKDLFGNETVRYAPYYKRGVSLEEFFSDLTQLKDYGKITTTSFKNSKNVVNYKGSNIIKINTTDSFNRETAAKDSQTLYIFTDNTDRSSGSKRVDSDSWYFKKYAVKDEETGKYIPLYYPEKSTTATLRGLPNAMPLSTQRWYHEGAKGKTGNWTDADIKEFQEVINGEIEAIKKAWSTNKYNQVKIPNIFNTRIANISEERTPVLYKYLSEALSDLYSTIDSSLSNKEAAESKALNPAEASLATSGEAATGVGAEGETDLDDATKKLIDRLDGEDELSDSTKRLIDRLDAEEEGVSADRADNDTEMAGFDGADARAEDSFSINGAEAREDEVTSADKADSERGEILSINGIEAREDEEQITSANNADSTDLEENYTSISAAEERAQQEAIAEVHEAEEEGPQDPENRICK